MVNITTTKIPIIILTIFITRTNHMNTFITRSNYESGAHSPSTERTAYDLRIVIPQEIRLQFFEIGPQLIEIVVHFAPSPVFQGSVIVVVHGSLCRSVERMKKQLPSLVRECSDFILLVWSFNLNGCIEEIELEQLYLAGDVELPFTVFVWNVLLLELIFIFLPVAKAVRDDLPVMITLLSRQTHNIVIMHWTILMIPFGVSPEEIKTFSC